MLYNPLFDQDKTIEDLIKTLIDTIY